MSIEAVFRQPEDIAEVRAAVEKMQLPDVAVSDVRIEGQRPNTQFMINTSEPNKDEVARN